MANGRAYVQVGEYEGGASALLAYDAGAFASPPLWQQRSGCNSVSPTVHLSIVSVGAFACRPSGDDGGVRWQVPGLSGDPAVAGGRVFAGTGADLQARSSTPGCSRGSAPGRLSDGARRWRTGTIAYGSPSVSGGRVYATGVRFPGTDQYAAVAHQFRLGG